MKFRRFILITCQVFLFIGLKNFSNADEVGNQDIQIKNLNLDDTSGNQIKENIQTTQESTPEILKTPKVKMTLKEKRQLKRQKAQEKKANKKQFKANNPAKKPKTSPLSKPFKQFEALNNKKSLQSLNYTISDVDIDNYWNDWKLQYGKSYKNEAVENNKKKTFVKKLKKILSHNRNYYENNVLFQTTIYGFGDTTPDEFIRLRTGFKVATPLKAKVNPKLEIKAKLPKKILLASDPGLDLTEYVTNVKDQADCGCCWAAASALAIETRLNQLGAPEILSTQQIVDCAVSPSLLGCDGGLPHVFYELLSVNNQTVSPIDEYEPFTAKQNTCKKDFEANTSNNWKLTGFHYKFKGNELDLKNAVDTYGACVIGIHAAPDLALYKMGIYTSKKCNSDSNHAVVVLGYGTDKRTKKSYWIIQNSWGPLWGENGTFRMLLGKNMCRVADYIACPIVERVSVDDDSDSDLDSD